MRVLTRCLDLVDRLLGRLERRRHVSDGAPVDQPLEDGDALGLEDGAHLLHRAAVVVLHPFALPLLVEDVVAGGLEDRADLRLEVDGASLLARQMAVDGVADDGAEVTAETSARGVVLEPAERPREAHHHELAHVLRVRRLEPARPRVAQDQVAVRPVELAPRVVVAGVGDAGDERRARGLFLHAAHSRRAAGEPQRDLPSRRARAASILAIEASASPSQADHGAKMTLSASLVLAEPPSRYQNWKFHCEPARIVPAGASEVKSTR